MSTDRWSRRPAQNLGPPACDRSRTLRPFVLFTDPPVDVTVHAAATAAAASGRWIFCAFYVGYSERRTQKLRRNQYVLQAERPQDRCGADVGPNGRAHISTRRTSRNDIMDLPCGSSTSRTPADGASRVWFIF